MCLAACGPVKLVATTNIPTPLVVKIPVAVAVHVPQEFSTFAHDEERSGTDWHIDLGKAQTDGLMRLLNAMFERVIVVDDVNAVPQAGADVRAVLEPAVEEYAFVTPRDAGSPFYAVSIKYRINVYTPDGRLADSWGFTGYGTAPSQGIASDEPLTQATALALRDAGAKLAVEFRDQAIVRGLLPESAVPDTPVLPPIGIPAATDAPAPPAVQQPETNPAEPAEESTEGADETRQESKQPDPVVPESLV
ncbi:MAG TPA: hypothetical protein PKE27_10350 [Povalibacter sp.]|nr:hypothetical protein [Povalibacter sp.]